MSSIQEIIAPLDQLYDPYPDETISFSSLPEESPILFLEYGILTEKIVDLVAEKRRTKQKADREFYIRKINNTLLKERQRSFEIPKPLILSKWASPDHSSYQIAKRKISSWTKYGSNKKQILDWFIGNQIPLVYLEELYQKQVSGPPKLQKNDYICINKESGLYGVVKEVKGKWINYYPISVKRYWNTEKQISECEIQWTTPIHLNAYQISMVCNRRFNTMTQIGKDINEELDEFLIPEELLFRNSPYVITFGNPGYVKGISIWKCEKVGHNDNWENEYEENKRKILKEVHFRQRFWLESTVLREINICAFYGWFNRDYDIIRRRDKPPIPTYHVGTNALGGDDELWTYVTKQAILLKHFSWA